MSSDDGQLEPAVKNTPNNITPVQQMISSCTGALITSFIVTPLDVVKIRLQAQQQPFKQGSCFIYSNGLMDCLCMCSHCNNDNNGTKPAKVVLNPWNSKPSSGQFTGTLDAFVKIARYEGISSLWSGLPPTLVMAIPATVFYFTTYDYLKYHMGYRDADVSTQYIPMLAGSTARIGTVILISPLELIRTKMQSQQLSYHEVVKALRVSVEHGGLLSLMRGVGPTLLRDVPFSALYWFGYEYVKALQLRHQGNKQVTFTQSFIAGATAGGMAALLTLPFDVVKTQRQIQMGQAELIKDTRIVSTWSVISQLYRQQGVSSLFAGLVPRLSKVAPACAIMISTYEYFKAFFHQKNTNISNSAKNWS